MVVVVDCGKIQTALEELGKQSKVGRSFGTGGR